LLLAAIFKPPSRIAFMLRRSDRPLIYSQPVTNKSSNEPKAAGAGAIFAGFNPCDWQHSLIEFKPIRRNLGA
jgi:hypothetical protein